MASGTAYVLMSNHVHLLRTPFFEAGLGNDDSERWRPIENYSIRRFLKTQINEIRNATNKAWTLGDSCFKEKMQLARRAEPGARGGGRMFNSLFSHRNG
ncbi:MAG TPA: hypothetical protein VIF37_19745 [Methylobacter sp.]